MTSALTAAQKRHANAGKVLDARLAAGEETTEARQQLAKAEQELERAKAREQERQAEAAAALGQEADALASGLSRDVQAALARILDGIGEPSPPSVQAATARTLVEARQSLTEARHELEARTAAT